MNRQIVILLFALGSLLSLTVMAANSKDVKSKLLNELNRTAPDDTVRLGILYKLVNVSENTQVKLYYINQLMKEAEEHDHSWYICRAYLSHLILCYNRYDQKEANRWMAKLEPIARKQNYLYFLFSGRRCIIDLYQLSGEYEREEREAKRMLEEAEAINYKTGTIFAYQCLANAYLMTYRFEEACNVLEEAYKISYQYDNGFILEVCSSLTRVYAFLERQADVFKWNRIMDKHLQDIIKKDPSQEHTLQLWLGMNALSYLNYYSAKEDYKSAELYLKQLDKYEISYDTFNVNAHNARISYFRKTGNMGEALKEMDKLLQIFHKELSLSSYVATNFYKAILLSEMGREDEAIDLYKKNLQLSDSVNIVLFNMQTEQMKKDYNADTLQLEQQRINWYMQCVFLILVVIIITVLIFFVVHNKKIQKGLAASEHNMRILAGRMEQANEAKDIFLSTISSSINVPLKEVVNGSLQLAMDEVTDEAARKEISRRLNKTSAELMVLINNILDLSRLEAGMMKFKESELEMISFLRGLVTSKREEGLEIRLNLSVPDDAQIMIFVDIARLQDVFNRLLIPSGDEGMILDINLADDGASLGFCITGTLLAVNSQSQLQEDAIGNEITRLLIKHFGGSYEIVSTIRPGIISFTLPVMR